MSHHAKIGASSGPGNGSVVSSRPAESIIMVQSPEFSDLDARKLFWELIRWMTTPCLCQNTRELRRLQEQLDALKAEEKTESEKILSPEQRKRLKEVLDGDKPKEPKP